MLSRRPVLVLVPLALLFVVVGLVEAWRDTPTVDETVDVAAGVTSLVRHDLRLNPEHGVLTHLLPALPALVAHPVVPDGAAYRTGDWFDHTDDFVRANESAGKLHRVVFLSRLVPLLEALAVAGFLYLLAARLIDPWAGVVAGGVWLTTPVFIGFGHIASVDVAFTLATLAVSLALLHFTESPSNSRAAVVALALGASLLTRHTALVLVLVAVGVAAAYCWRAARGDALRYAGVMTVGAWLTVWIFYRVLFFGSPTGEAGARLDGIISAGRSDSALTRLVLAVPWPKEWAAGFAYLVETSVAKPAYLLGHAWNGGRWWYFLGVIPVKLTFVLVALLVVGPFGWRRVESEQRRQALAVVAAPAVVLYLAIAFQPLDLGLRYAFPVVALWLVGASAIVRLLHGRVRIVAAVVLVVTQLGSVAAAAPHSLAWTPPPFQSGYRWATDSNIDYGQDDGRVDDWARDKQPYVALLSPRGFDPPPGSRSLLDTAPSEIRGWVAASATRLTALDRDKLSWLRAYCPVGTIGGSVLLYYFDEPVDTRPGPTMPVGVCAGDVSRRTG